MINSITIKKEIDQSLQEYDNEQDEKNSKDELIFVNIQKEKIKQESTDEDFKSIAQDSQFQPETEEYKHNVFSVSSFSQPDPLSSSSKPIVKKDLKCIKCHNSVTGHPKPTGKNCQLAPDSVPVLEKASFKICKQIVKPNRRIWTQTEENGHKMISVSSFSQPDPLSSSSKSKPIPRKDHKCSKCHNSLTNHPKPTGKNCRLAPDSGPADSGTVLEKESSRICKKCGRLRKGHQLPIGKNCQLTPLSNFAEIIAEKREQRRERSRTQIAASRAEETEEKREQRLEQNRNRVAASRDTNVSEIRIAGTRLEETEEKRVKRLEQNRLRIAAIRAAETEEEREQRLEQMRLRHAKKKLEKEQPLVGHPNI